MTAPTLLPCPFCGQPCRIQQNGRDKVTGKFTWWEIACDTCDFLGPAFDVREEVVAHWNTRADPLRAALAVPEVRALVEALEHCLGTITTGMDGVWDHTVNAADLARAALRGIGEGGNG